MYAFGSGVLIGTRTDLADATPINFGLVQEVQLDLSFTSKELYGQYQWPVAIARGQGKITGKAKMARISGIAFNSLFFGQSLEAGQRATAFGEAGTIPAGAPYTLAALHAASFAEDCGVIDAASGLPLAKVASAPAAGQYSVAAGSYGFAAADAGKPVLLSYTYDAAGSGQQITLANPLMGTTPSFRAQLFTSFEGQPLSVTLFNCVSNKLLFQTKLEDFTVPELDFSVAADTAGNVLNWSFGEVS